MLWNLTPTAERQGIQGVTSMYKALGVGRSKKKSGFSFLFIYLVDAQ
jgi:hypothetical protein